MKEKDKNKEETNNSKLSSNSANEPTPIYLNDDSTLQTPEEDQRDKSKDPRENDRFETGKE
jgi:hypothetical protein